jgi:hypothetical protein
VTDWHVGEREFALCIGGGQRQAAADARAGDTMAGAVGTIPSPRRARSEQDVDREVGIRREDGSCLSLLIGGLVEGRDPQRPATDLKQIDRRRLCSSTQPRILRPPQVTPGWLFDA